MLLYTSIILTTDQSNESFLIIENWKGTVNRNDEEILHKIKNGLLYIKTLIPSTLPFNYIE